jgi:hypothetical protein
MSLSQAPSVEWRLGLSSLAYRSQRIETTAQPMQCQTRCKSRSRGLDTALRRVYPEPAEGLRSYLDNVTFHMRVIARSKATKQSPPWSAHVGRGLLRFARNDTCCGACYSEFDIVKLLSQRFHKN